MHTQSAMYSIFSLLKRTLYSQKQRPANSLFPGGGPYSWGSLVGVCRPGLQILTIFQTKGRTIRKFMGGGAGEIQKKYSREGKLNEEEFLHAS